MSLGILDNFLFFFKKGKKYQIRGGSIYIKINYILIVII